MLIYFPNRKTVDYGGSIILLQSAFWLLRYQNNYPFVYEVYICNQLITSVFGIL